MNEELQLNACKLVPNARSLKNTSSYAFSNLLVCALYCVLYFIDCEVFNTYT